MTTQPSRSRFPWLAVIIAAFLALAGVGLLAYAALSIITLPGARASKPTPAATAQVATQAIAQSNVTPVIIPTITEAPQQAPTQAVADTAEPNSPAPTAAEAATAIPATVAPTADLNLKILQPANVRSGPGLVYPVIGGLQAGTSIPAEVAMPTGSGTS